MASCAQHPDIHAPYRCEGCEKYLCDQCIEESYRLLLCKQCGERALPLEQDRPATTEQLSKARTRAASANYTFKDALSYPFRGGSKWMFIAALVVYWLSNLRSIYLTILMSMLLAALQFHIVRRTVNGEDELDDWPDFSAWTDFIPDLFAWIILEGSVRITLGLYLGVGFVGGFMGFEPSLLGAMVMALILWFLSAFQVMGYGAVANYSLWHLFWVHLHIIGYAKTLGDALKYTNLVFGLRGVVFLIQGALAEVPYMGAILSTGISVYFIFLVPHFSGLLFRQHEDLLDDLYLDRS